MVKRATEVCNYFPTPLPCGTWTTPLELAHNIKPDLRVLFKPFSVAAVCRERHGDIQLGKFEPQSVPMIAVGCCANSNSIQFYNPANGTFVSSVDFKIQHNVTSGAYFGLKYQPGVFIYRLDESTMISPRNFPLIQLCMSIHILLRLLQLLLVFHAMKTKCLYSLLP